MTIFNSVRELLSQGDTQQALRLLITYLEKDNNSPEALRILRVVEANFNYSRKKEIKGILDASEAQIAYSKTTDALLSVTEDLAAGRKPSLEVTNTEQQKSRVYWLIGGGIMLLLGIIAGILLINNASQSARAIAAEKTISECPEFDTSGVTIMLIPFKNLGDVNSSPEVAIQTRIRDITQRNNVKCDAQIFLGDRFKTNSPDNNRASEIGRSCAAQMVIWGDYEKLEKSISLDVRYIFTEKPNLPTGVVFDNFRNLSELKAGNSKFNSLEDAVFSLCTVMALHEGNMPLAEKWIEKVKEPNAQIQRVKEMIAKR